MPTAFGLRPAVQADAVFLGDMIVEAANWRAPSALPRHQVLTGTDHSRYVAGWMRSSDAGFLAVDPQDAPIGAAWYRMLTPTEPGFGYVSPGVPELTIGVRPIWRAHGVGRALLQRLCDHAREQGHPRISLSVQRGSFAATLYRSEGFAVIGPGAGRDTMIKRLR